MARKFRRDAEEGSQGTFRRMSKCERFRIGDQWDYDVKQRSKYLRKHTLTINMIHPHVEQLVGQQVQNPRDLRVIFSKSSSRIRANLLTALTKQVTDNSHAHRISSFCFANGITTGRGWLGIDIRYDDDPVRGDYVVNQYDPFMVLVDTNCKKYDINHPKGGAKFAIVDEWVPKETLELQYPKKAAGLKGANYSTSDDQGVYGYYAQLTSSLFGRSDPGGVTDDYRDNDSLMQTGEDSRNNQHKYNYRKSTIWWKEPKKGVYIQNVQEPLEFLLKYKQKDISTARKAKELFPDRIRLIDKDPEGKPLVVGVLHKMIVVGDILLEDIEDPLDGIMTIPLVRYSPYFINGYEFGLVQNLIGPQEELNWSRSMFLNLSKVLANTGWIVGKLLGKAKEWLKTHGSEDGVIIDKSKYGTIEKIEQNEPNQALLITAAQSMEDMGQISNVRRETPQTDKDRVAAAIRLKQASAERGTASMSSNWDYTYELFGTILVEMIRLNGTFTVDEIRAIVDEEDLIDPQLMNEATEEILGMFEGSGNNLQQPPEPPNAQEISGMDPEMQQVMIDSFENEMQEYRAIMSTVNEMAKRLAESMLFDEIEQAHKGSLGLKVSMSPMAESMRVIKQLETYELHKVLLESNYPGISRNRLIDAADPPNKEAILAEGVSAPAMAQAVQGGQ